MPCVSLDITSAVRLSAFPDGVGAIRELSLERGTLMVNALVAGGGRDELLGAYIDDRRLATKQREARSSFSRNTW